MKLFVPFIALLLKRTLMMVGNYRSNVKLVFAFWLFALMNTTAHAVPITYTVTASSVAHGELGGISFLNAGVHITGTGDTTGVFVDPDGSGGWLNRLTSASFTVMGIGSSISGIITDSIGVFAVPGQGRGGMGCFTCADPTLMLNLNHPALGAYDLTTAIQTTGHSHFAVGASLRTTVGGLTLGGACEGTLGCHSTFTAVVPEPSSWLLLVIGLVVLTNWRSTAGRESRR
jgi:hypothetical protein